MVVLTNFEPPTDGIIHRETASAAYMQGKTLGHGTLYIAESRLSWVGDDGKGFSVEYPAISIHAISKDMTAFPHQCLYLILDCDLDDTGASGEGRETESGRSTGEGEDDEEDRDEDEVRSTELRFVPRDPVSLDAMYQAMCAAQELHPDAEQAESDSDDEWYCGEDGAAGDGGAAGNVDEGGSWAQLGDDDAGAHGDEAQLAGGADTHENNGVGDAGGYIGDAMDTGQFDDVDSNEDDRAAPRDSR